MTNGVEEQQVAVKPRRRRRILLWSGVVAGMVLAGILTAGEIILHRAGPMLKAKVIDTLSTRFDSRVELARFNVSVFKGFQVSGRGLKLYPNHLPMAEPLISVDRFSFRALNWRQLFETPMYINRVEVRGLTIHMPPKGERANLPQVSGSGNSSGPGIKVLVGEIMVNHASLLIENGKPGKKPMDFEIDRLKLNSVGAGRPMKFHATLVNPKPIGNIDSSGDFGPFNMDSPGDTPVDGVYKFRKADLSTLKGIGGMLSSDGSYRGQLNHIEVDGETKTPNFELDTARHPMQLNTKFHAIVDGTNGDTYLQPVDAWLNRTHIVARGKVVRVEGAHGRDIQLDVTVDPGRIQDLLELAVNTRPPVMNGAVQVHMKMELPPGSGTVTDRLELQGSFAVMGARFSNPKIQSRVDQLSLRGQGHPDLAKQESDAMKSGNVPAGTKADVASDMRGNFTMGLRKLNISALNYQVPGAQVALNGVYSLDGQTFNFTGTARLEVHVSQMVTGWKSWLLKPVDPFFAKNGAGTQVPIRITGTKSSPQFGLNY